MHRGSHDSRAYSTNRNLDHTPKSWPRLQHWLSANSTTTSWLTAKLPRRRHRLSDDVLHSTFSASGHRSRHRPALGRPAWAHASPLDAVQIPCTIPNSELGYHVPSQVPSWGIVYHPRARTGIFWPNSRCTKIRDIFGHRSACVPVPNLGLNFQCGSPLAQDLRLIWTRTEKVVG